jgi:hypothetical protein
MGMSFGPQNRLYVVELKADRIAVISLSGMDNPTTGDDKQSGR